MTAHRWQLARGLRSAEPVHAVGLRGRAGGLLRQLRLPLTHYSYGYGNGEALAVTDVPPPAPYYEVQPVMPYVGAVWFSGYWNWYGGRYVWAPGYWGAGRPGYVWHPYRWAPYGNRWNLYAGGWARPLTIRPARSITRRAAARSCHALPTDLNSVISLALARPPR